jgi:uncharacterized membrane protein
MSEAPLRILLAGETWITHTLHIKGVDQFMTSGFGEGTKWLRRAYSGPGFRFEHLSNHAAITDFPATVDALSTYDVVILSDIGSNTLLFHPDTTERSLRTPNRLVALREYVRAGGGLVMVGGYMSFQGIEGRANYHATPVAEALPVKMLPGIDDRVEVPEGFAPTLTALGREHRITMGLPATFPALLSRNRVEAKAEAETLLETAGEPILTVWDFGTGRSAAFMADAAPHGATPEFLDWEHFDRFWQRLAEWLARRL